MAAAPTPSDNPSIIAGVKAVPSPAEPQLYDVMLTVRALDGGPDCRELPLANRLGLPLRVFFLRDPASAGKPNHLVSRLNAVVDPASQRFGFVAWSNALASQGPAYLYRADGVAFTANHAAALMTYVSAEHTSDLFEVARRCRQRQAGRQSNHNARVLLNGTSDPEDVAQIREVVDRLVTPAAFMRFFEKYRAMRTVTHPAWAQVEDPIDPTKICGICGAKESKDGTKLFVCHRCRGQAYCSQECKDTDWTWHVSGCNVIWERWLGGKLIEGVQRKRKRSARQSSGEISLRTGLREH